MNTEEFYQQANEITDGLGMHIDEGIKKILVGLWSHEIQTSGSCEGHKNRGLPFPWVDIESDDPKGWEDDEAIQTKWKVLNDSQVDKLRLLLDKFDKSTFILKPRGLYGAVRLQPDEDSVKPELLTKHQQQINEFANFLLNR